MALIVQRLFSHIIVAYVSKVSFPRKFLNCFRPEVTCMLMHFRAVFKVRWWFKFRRLDSTSFCPLYCITTFRLDSTFWLDFMVKRFADVNLPAGNVYVHSMTLSTVRLCRGRTRMNTMSMSSRRCLLFLMSYQTDAASLVAAPPSSPSSSTTPKHVRHTDFTTTGTVYISAGRYDGTTAVPYQLLTVPVLWSSHFAELFRYREIVPQFYCTVLYISSGQPK